MPPGTDMMLRLLLFVSASLWLIAQPAAAQHLLEDTTGPYRVVMEMDPTLPDHTIYRPADMAAIGGRLPVVSFGNGACRNIGSLYQPFLGEVASHGYLVVATGPIGNDRAAGDGAGDLPQSTNESMQAAIDWAIAENARNASLYRNRIGTDSIAVAGHSCGGLQAIAVGADPRVATVMVLNSGIIRGGIPTPDGGVRQPAGYMPATEADLANLHTPILYIAGGESDQAKRGADGDFDQIESLPVFYANLPVGHSGTWRELHGGRMGAVALAWLDWQLKRDAAAGRTFAGDACGLCEEPDWSIRRKQL